MQIQLPEQFATQEEAFLVSIFQQVLSPTQSSVFLSGAIFNELETKKGYMECLLRIVYNSEYSFNIRQLAVITLKNCVSNKWWRHTVCSQEGNLSEDDKNTFSVMLMQCYASPLDSPSLMTHLSLIIARIARVDYPERLGNYLDVTEQLICSSNTHCIYQGSNSLLGFIRAFSTCRVGRQRAKFQQIIPKLYQMVSSSIDRFPSIGSDSLTSEILHCEMSSLYKLVTRGIPPKVDSPMASEFPSLMSRLLHIQLACLQRNDILTDIGLIKSMKWCIRTLTFIALSSLPSIESLQSDYASLCQSFLFSVFNENTQIDTLAELYPVVEVVINAVSELLKRSNSVPSLHQFYTDEKIIDLLRCLQCHMFPLSPTQRSLLDENPESAFWTLSNSIYRQKLFSLYEILLQLFPQQVIQIINETYQTLSTSSESAIYGLLCFLQRGGNSISGKVNYDGMATTVLFPLLHEDIPPSLAIECVSVVSNCFYLFGESLRESLVRGVVSITHHTSVAVRLAGVGCLTQLLDGSPTSVPIILHCFEEILNQIIYLYKNATSEESRGHLLTLCESLIKRCDGDNRCMQMLQVFDVLWSSARADGDLTSQPRLIRLLSAIVSRNEACVKTFVPALLQVVEYAVQSGGEMVVNLCLEDGLTLWSLTLRIDGLDYGEMIHNLFNCLIAVYSRDMKNFTVAMSILDAYFCLGKDFFVRSYRDALREMYALLIDVVSISEVVRLATSIHTVLLLFPVEGAYVAQSVLEKIVPVLLRREETDSNGNLAENVYVSYLLIVGQALINEGEGLQLFAYLCNGLQIREDDFFSALLSSFLRSFDSAGGGAIGYVRRSLFVKCMLFCILNGGENCFINVMSEMEVGEEKMRLLFSEKNLGRADKLSNEYLKQFVAQTNIQNSFKLFLSQLEGKYGSVNVQNRLSMMDPSITSTLSAFLSSYNNSLICFISRPVVALVMNETGAPIISIADSTFCHCIILL